MDESIQNSIETGRLAEIIKQLTSTQLRFVIARNDSKSDKEAAEIIGISSSTVRNWDNKATVDEAIRLMLVDGVITARELRRRNLAKAMAVKVAGLDSVDEKLRQSVATEIVEWEMGKAQSSVDVTSKGEQIAFVNVGVDLDKI